MTPTPTPTPTGVPTDWFTVTTAIADLAVGMRGSTVTDIRLNAHGHRSAQSAAERRVESELQAYAEGDRTVFTFAFEPEGTVFDRKVWQAVGQIPFGATQTYGAIANALGVPGGARAVGHANGRNPIPIVIPCHRVVAAGGKLGGYGGGLPLKRRLLALEERVRGLRPVLSGLLALLGFVAAAACADPARPEFGFPSSEVDTSGPTIEFLPPNGGTVFPVGSLITVQVRITDRHVIRSVSAGVQGIANFGFPTEFPDDTTFSVQYRVQAPAGSVGLILFTVTAMDELEFRSHASRTYRLE